MTESRPETTLKAYSLPLDRIVRDPDFQARVRIRDRDVKRYADVLKNGGAFEPIQVAKVGNVYILVDGWHRLLAHEAREEPWIEAVITEMTRDDAKRAAALANIKNGVSLKYKDKRRVFQLFIQGKGHRLGRGRLKSYRQIASELGGLANYTTIREWMRRDFPRIFREMGNEGQVRETGGLYKQEEPTVEEMCAQRCQSAQEIIRANHPALDERERQSLARELLGLAEEVKSGGTFVPFEHQTLEEEMSEANKFNF